MAITQITDQERLELESLTGKKLPTRPGDRGWTADQIKRVLYEGTMYLFDLLLRLQNEVKGDFQFTNESLQRYLDTMNDYESGKKVAHSAQCDELGNNIMRTYLKAASYRLIQAKHRINIDDKDGILNELNSMTDLSEGDLIIFQTPLDGATELEEKLPFFLLNGGENNYLLISSHGIGYFYLGTEGNYSIKYILSTANMDEIINEVVKNANYTVPRSKADQLGNNIKDTYETKSDALSKANECHTFATNKVLEIVNGILTAAKAVKDTNGNVIHETYVNKNTDIVDDLNSTDTNKPLSANQGKALKGLIDSIQAILQSDDLNLDTVQELVTYIKHNKKLIDSITTEKVSITDIVDNLTSAVANKPLSANQGKQLNDIKVNITDIVDVLTSNETNKPLSARLGKVLLEKINSVDAAKYGKEEVDTKAEVNQKITNALGNVENMNVIHSVDENKNYTFQFKIVDGELHFIATEVTI